MVFRFDRFLVDPSRFRLESDGEEQAIEPRVFDLLHYLIRHRDRVVSRDELLEQVWEGQIVGDAALTRSVYEARRALGDDAKQQRYLRTVHGRGLQFVGEVEELVEPIASQNDSRPSESRPSDSGPSDSGNREPGRSENDPARAPSRPWSYLLLAGAAALVVAIVLLRPQTAERLGPPVDDPPDDPPIVRLGMLPWTEDSAVTELQLLELGLSDYLAMRLGAAPGWIVRSVDQMRPSIDRLPSLEEVAEAEAVSYLLGGQLSIPLAEDRAVLDLVLYTMNDGGRPPHELPVGRYELPLLTSDDRLAEFNRIRRSVTDDLVEQVGPATRLVDDRGLATGRLTAYRLVVRAKERLAAKPCDGGGALALAEQATEIDPDFANAWAVLAVAHYNRAWCGGDMSGLDLGVAAARQARDLSPALAEQAIAAEGTWKVEAGELEAAWEAVRPESIDGSEPELLYSRAYILRYAGYIEAGEHYLRTLLEVDPLFLARAPQAESPNLLLYQNRFDEFLALLPTTESAFHRYYQALATLLTDRPARAGELAESCFRDDPASIYGRFCHALHSILNQDLDRARTICEQIETQRVDLGHTDGEVTYKLAQLFALADDSEAALEQFRIAVEQGFVPVSYFRIDPVFAQLRERPAFRKALAAAEMRHRAFGTRFGLSQQAH